VRSAVAARSRQRDDWFDGALRRLHGDARVAAVWLFGSLARGDADGLSDVDMFCRIR
jgi:predicted nucleotidyltransferase